MGDQFQIGGDQKRAIVANARGETCSLAWLLHRLHAERACALHSSISYTVLIGSFSVLVIYVWWPEWVG